MGVRPGRHRSGIPDGARLMPPQSDEATSALPEVLSAVLLHIDLREGASVDLPSRVSDLDVVDDVPRVVVARPDLGALAERGTYPREGEELTLAWARPACQMQMTVTATAERRPYGPVWVLTALSQPKRVQRREYFRIPTSLPVVLTPLVDGAPSEDEAVPATLVELAEGGALICSEAGLPELGDLVHVSFVLQGRTIATDAKVVRHDAVPKGPPRAALRFLDPGVHGDHIRRVAFSVQRTLARGRPD
jgi:c-di-GMP-binding flagellar brake protein YcgR